MDKRQIIIWIPFTALVAGLLQMSPGWSRAFGVQLYGFVIFACCFLVHRQEYTSFFAAHKQKNFLADMLIICMASLGMYHFLAKASDLANALWGMDIFLVSACFWQFYTMKVNKYFAIGDESWTSWFRLLAEPLFPWRMPVAILHRDEYRYWLLFDGIQVIFLTPFLVFYDSFLRTVLPTVPDLWLLSIGIFGIAIQLYNFFRYRVVLRRTEAARRTFD